MWQWYNGYHFSGDMSVSVYNPFSILNYLHKQVCQNYWILSGKHSFLLEYLKREKYSLDELEAVCNQPAKLSVHGGDMKNSLLDYFVDIKEKVPAKRVWLLGQKPMFERLGMIRCGNISC